MSGEELEQGLGVVLVWVQGLGEGLVSKQVSEQGVGVALVVELGEAPGQVSKQVSEWALGLGEAQGQVYNKSSCSRELELALGLLAWGMARGAQLDVEQDVGQACRATRT
jgi:hypothetical protein